METAHNYIMECGLLYPQNAKFNNENIPEAFFIGMDTFILKNARTFLRIRHEECIHSC